jgi:hypothetical protein
VFRVVTIPPPTPSLTDTIFMRFSDDREGLHWRSRLVLKPLGLVVHQPTSV